METDSIIKDKLSSLDASGWAYPQPPASAGQVWKPTGGLTRREFFAALIMQGLTVNGKGTAAQNALTAATGADSLVAALGD